MEIKKYDNYKISKTIDKHRKLTFEERKRLVLITQMLGLGTGCMGNGGTSRARDEVIDIIEIFLKENSTWTELQEWEEDFRIFDKDEEIYASFDLEDGENWDELLEKHGLKNNEDFNMKTGYYSKNYSEYRENDNSVREYLKIKAGYKYLPTKYSMEDLYKKYKEDKDFREFVNGIAKV